MTGPDRVRLAELDLEVTLRAIAPSVAWPAAGVSGDGRDLASRVGARLVATPRPADRRRPAWRPARRAAILALAAVLILAAVAAAVAFGIPGIRLVFGEPPVTAPPSAAVAQSPPPGPPGAGLGLGRSVPVDDLDRQAGFAVRTPSDPAIGPPDVAWLDTRGIVTLVWAPTTDLPVTTDPGIGLVMTQFRGGIDQRGLQKTIDIGTDVEPVEVGGNAAYWLSGDVHYFSYTSPSGGFAEDGARWVGDALIWSDGGRTFRLETSLGRDAAIRIAESVE